MAGAALAPDGVLEYTVAVSGVDWPKIPEAGEHHVKPVLASGGKEAKE